MVKPTDPERQLVTRARIATAAERVRRSGQRVLVKAVAAEAGVSTRTVSRYFPRLVDALDLTLPSEMVAAFLDIYRKVPSGPSPLEAINAAVGASVDFLGDPDRICRLAAAVAASPENLLVAQAAFTWEWEEPFLATFAERAGRSEPNCADRAAFAAAAGLAYALLRDWANARFTPSLQELWKISVESLTT